jgi:single-stranded-DNA-specific exonuclease
MKRWEVLQEQTTKTPELKIEDIIKILFENRGIAESEREEFIHPHFERVTTENVQIDKTQLTHALKRIQKAMTDKEQIIVYGDYDVDGITGTAILWETLNALGANALPYIPHRVDEGYGLSIKGIENLLEQNPHIKLIITVDNGIVAKDAVKFANSKNIEVIITDHHEKDAELPDALAIVHTTKLCGAGVAYLLSKELHSVIPSDRNDNEDTHLELATLGTIADLVPLTGANRAVVKFGLPQLSRTKRVGLQELFKQASITKEELGVYEIGFIIGPRLNAAGRIESAMDSLRLLCTRDKKRAQELAAKLEITNRERQLIMKESAQHAVLTVKAEASLKKILIVAHESYNQGVIGLVAGKLVEEFYRPAIVLAKGDKYSKASVRSVSGFNIIEFLRSQPEFFVNVGGHPMAAGFTIETEKLIIFKQTLEELAESLLDDETLTKSIKIDCEIPFSLISPDFYKSLQQLAPFGMGNPEPTFATKDVTIVEMRVLGKESNHLKLFLRKDKTSFDAIAFGFGELARELKIGDKIDVAYNIDINEWNGNKKLQLKVKDIKTKSEV